MAFTLVQSASASFISAGSFTTSFTNPVTTGNLVVVSFLLGLGTITGTVTCSDTIPNTYTALTGVGLEAGTGPFTPVAALYGFYAPNVTGGFTNVTVTLSSALGVGAMIIREYAGVRTSSPLDVQGWQVANSSSTPASSTVTTTFAPDLALGFLATLTTGTVSLGLSYADLITQAVTVGANTVTIAMEDRTLASTGNFSASFGVSSSANNGVGIVTFKGPVAPNSSHTLLLMGVG